MKSMLAKVASFFVKNFKLIIGIAVLILAVALFFMTQYKTTSLEDGNLQKWTESPVEHKISTVKLLTDDAKDTELIVSCVDKMSTFNDSGEFAVRDAVKLCNMGIQLRENN
jgi:hypothetical protein